MQDLYIKSQKLTHFQDRQLCLFVCVEVLRPSQPYGVMSSAVCLTKFVLVRVSPRSG